MKILILEDDDRRISKFKENFIGCQLFITHLPQTANKWLEEEEFDLIFLDCDLDEQHYNSAVWKTEDCSEFDSTSGVCTAKFLGNNTNLCKDTTVIIHSQNPVGSERMFYALGKRVKHRIPYGETMWKRLIIDKNI